MNAPLLSICIATHNRAELLVATLAAILPQLDEESELVIVDGASSDATPQVLAAHQNRHPRLRYLRQEVNGGVDRDFCAAVQLARGRYCWLFSDDDLLVPDAVARVRAHLDEGHSLVIVNAEVRGPDLTTVLEPRRARIAADRLYQPGEDDRLFVDTAFYLSFIGAVIIDRALWLEREKESFIGSEFIHIGVIFQSPLPRSTRFLADPLVEIRYGNAKWTGRRFEIWMFRWPALVWSLPRSRAAKRKVVAQERWRNPALLLGHRALGAYTIDEYRRLIAPRCGPPAERLLARLIARLPPRPLNALARGVLWLLPRHARPLVAWDLQASYSAGAR